MQRFNRPLAYARGSEREQGTESERGARRARNLRSERGAQRARNPRRERNSRRERGQRRGWRRECGARRAGGGPSRKKPRTPARVRALQTKVRATSFGGGDPGPAGVISWAHCSPFSRTPAGEACRAVAPVLLPRAGTSRPFPDSAANSQANTDCAVPFRFSPRYPVVR